MWNLYDICIHADMHCSQSLYMTQKSFSPQICGYLARARGCFHEKHPQDGMTTPRLYIAYLQKSALQVPWQAACINLGVICVPRAGGSSRATISGKYCIHYLNAFACVFACVCVHACTCVCVCVRVCANAAAKSYLKIQQPILTWGLFVRYLQV